MEDQITITVTHANGKSDTFVSAPKPKTKAAKPTAPASGPDYVEITVTHPDGSMTVHRSSPSEKRASPSGATD